MHIPTGSAIRSPLDLLLSLIWIDIFGIGACNVWASQEVVATTHMCIRKVVKYNALSLHLSACNVLLDPGFWMHLIIYVICDMLGECRIKFCCTLHFTLWCNTLFSVFPHPPYNMSDLYFQWPEQLYTYLSRNIYRGILICGNLPVLIACVILE